MKGKKIHLTKIRQFIITPVNVHTNEKVIIKPFFLAPSQKMDASQEITALGLCNFIGSFVGSMPVTASFGRSAINSSSGVRTPFGGCITGLIILAGEK